MKHLRMSCSLLVRDIHSAETHDPICLSGLESIENRREASNRGRGYSRSSHVEMCGGGQEEEGVLSTT